MSDPLIIQIQGDNAPWNRAVAATKAGAKSAADAQSREAARAAKEMARQAKIATDSAAKERQREVREATRAFDQITRENAKHYAQANREAKAGADAAVKEAKRGADGIAREAQRAAAAQVSEQRKWERQNVISLGSLQNAGIKYQDRMRSEADKSANAQAKAAARAARAHQDGFSASSMAANSFAGAIQSLAGEFALLNVGKMAIGAIAEAFHQARDQAYDAAKFSQEFRESLLEIAALRDRLGGTTKETAEQLAFRSQTLQTSSAATAYQEAYLGAGEAGVKAGIITPGESQRLGVLGGQFQAVEGGDALAHGKLAAMMPQITGLHTADENFAKIQQVYQTLKPGNFPKYSQGINQLAGVANLTQIGAFKDISEEAALLSAYSTFNPEESGTMVEHAVRASMGSFGRAKGPKMDDAEAMKVGAYLKSIGVTKDMKSIPVLDKIVEDVAKAEAAAGGGFNMKNYLMSRGYGNMQDQAAVESYYALNRKDPATGKSLWKDTFLATSQKPGDAAGVQADIARWQHSDPLARGRRAQISADAAKATIGMGGMEDYMNLQRQAYDVMVAKGEMKGDYDYNAKDYWHGGNTKIQQQLFGAMAAEARTHGIDAGRKYGSYDSRSGMPLEGTAYWDFGKAGSVGESQWWNMDDRARAAKLADINANLGASGSNVSAELLRELIVEQKKANTLAQKQIDMANQGTPPAIAPARPAAPLRRP